jgi:tetrapyrrole methylase family protein / MazG family protein
MKDPGTAFKKLTDIMDSLMSADGCPWDKAQSRESLKPYLLEETYETLEALDSNEAHAIKDELGDLLFQIIFHAKISSLNKEFDIHDVVENIAEKMVRRHPHVFDQGNLTTPDQVAAQWDEIKKLEKGQDKRKSVLDGIPKSSPALKRAQQLQKKAAKNGFDWERMEDIFEKLEEEMGELKTAVLSGDTSSMEDEFGDLLFVMVNIAQRLKIDSEEALRSSNNKFVRRFQYIEKKISESGEKLNETPLERMDHFWDEAKRVLEKKEPPA